MAMFNAPSDQVVGETVTGPILGCVKTGYEPVLTAFADNFEHRGLMYCVDVHYAHGSTGPSQIFLKVFQSF